MTSLFFWWVQGQYFWLICFPPGTKPAGRVFFWSYVYYLSKFYELLDTLILVLKGKPLTFLHVYHHATVIAMCFFWLEVSTPPLGSSPCASSGLGSVYPPPLVSLACAASGARDRS